MDLRMRMDVLSASQKQSFSVQCAPSPLNELPEPSKEHKYAWDERKDWFNLLPKKETRDRDTHTNTPIIDHASWTCSPSPTIPLTEKICQGKLLSKGTIGTRTFGLSGMLFTAFHPNWTDHRLPGTNLYLTLTIEHHSRRF